MLVELARLYVENDRISYRQAVRVGKMPLGYRTVTGARRIDERGLAPTTVWRMLTWLGGQLPGLERGRQLILERKPGSTCHRFVGAVAPHKFRSPQRQRSLQTSRRLLHLIAEWNELFPEPFFPRFATRSGFV